METNASRQMSSRMNESLIADIQFHASVGVQFTIKGYDTEEPCQEKQEKL